MDRRVCVASTFISTKLTEIRNIYREDFIGDRYYYNVARKVAVVAALFVSFTYVAGQMRGVGVVFSVLRCRGRYWSIYRYGGGAILCFFWRDERHHLYPSGTIIRIDIRIYGSSSFLSLMAPDNPVPQSGMGSTGSDGMHLLDKLDGLMTNLGFTAYTDGTKSTTDIFFLPQYQCWEQPV